MLGSYFLFCDSAIAAVGGPICCVIGSSRRGRRSSAKIAGGDLRSVSVKNDRGNLQTTKAM